MSPKSKKFYLEKLEKLELLLPSLLASATQLAKEKAQKYQDKKYDEIKIEIDEIFALFQKALITSMAINDIYKNILLPTKEGL